MHRLLRVPYAINRSLQHQTRKLISRSDGQAIHVRQAGFGKVVFILTPFVAVGGAITYAKYDTNFRKYLERNIPGAEYIIKVALQEEKPFKVVGEQFDNVKDRVGSISSSISGFFGSAEKETKTQPESVKSKFSEPQKKVPDMPAAKATRETKSALPQVKPVEPLPSDIIELEHAVEVSAALAVQEYNKAIDNLKNFNNDVRRIVDQSIENVNPSLWHSLRNKTSARDTYVATAENMARDALNKIEKCEIALAKAAKPENHDQIIAVRNKIKTLIDHINRVKDELYRNKDLANMSEKYWKNVEKARNYFVEEIETIFPGIDLSKQKLNLTPEDLDLFITHAYSHVLALQKELQRLQTDGELRLKRAIDSMRGDNDSDTVKAQLEYMLESERRKLALENQKKILNIRSDSEKQLRQQLKKQAEAHSDHLQDVVNMKESELKRQYTRELEDKMATEKANYKLQLAAMLGKIRGMDAAMQARAEGERSSHQAQALWAACQALWSSVRTGEPGTHWKAKLRPLRNEIKAIKKVAEGDELVTVVIQNLPVEAAERGVYPEDALRERFLNVERIARKVALIPEQGASLPKYFLSYLQSLFILKPSDPISKAELQNAKFDYSKLDVYEILNRARYFIDHGDLMMALKYMNLLQGAPRKIASDWLKETRLLLETQQAANTLMAHAAASGLLYL
uniref:MICOS complex subunit MIC60 n=1 Tax=Glossina palpalis gambiensis TaxID=67801 RepID=A0A1B0BMJ6_9MUSC